MENPAGTEEISVYDDLVCQGDLGALIHNLQKKNSQLQLHVVSLEEDIQKLCDRITEMKHTQDNLSRNISELYKTARSEIDRKDRLIADLQSKLDDVVFRRNSVQNNFVNKRFREEQSNVEVEMKKPRYENKAANINREEDFPTVKNTHVNDVKNENVVTGVKMDSNDFRHRNSMKNERDSRDYSVRFDNDHRRRRSNSRDRNFRRDFRDSRGRNRSNERDRNFRNRGNRGGRESYKPRQRNEYSERDRFSRADVKEQSDMNNQRSFPEDLTRIPPKPPQETNIDLSKEEGELTDVETENQSHKTNSKQPKKNEENKSSDSKREEYPNDEVKKFDVTKFIENQKKMSVKKNTEWSSKENCEKKIEKKHVKQDDEIKHDKYEVKEKPLEKPDCASIKIADSNFKNEPNEEPKPITKSEKTAEKEEKKDGTVKVMTEKIKILSHVKLKVGKVEAVTSKIENEPETHKEQPRKSDEVRIQTIPKMDRNVKESRVPRNLIEDLDIKVDKQTQKLTDKAKETNALKKTKQTEKIQQKMSSLFDTPVKKETKPESKVEPDLESKETSSNQSVIDKKETLTPVTEFQIFKTNLTCLEKSNSLTNIQFQTNAVSKTDEVPKQNKENQSDKNRKTVNPKISKKKNSFENALKTGQTFVKNESAGYGNTSDICNISLDMLNAQICNYKPEDFPNLAAHTEKDSSNMLLTSMSKVVDNHVPAVPESQKAPNSEQVLEKEVGAVSQNKTIPFSEQVPKISAAQNQDQFKKEDSTTLNEGNNADSSVVSSSSPSTNIGNARKKRKRCVMKWIE